MKSLEIQNISDEYSVSSEERVILFDGVCGLCNQLVLFLMKRNKQYKVRLASVQSPIGQRYLKACKLPQNEFDTLVLIHRDKAYFKSSACLRITVVLSFPWPMFSLALIIPPFIRNWCYDRIAQNRYKWFGKKDNCMLPTPDTKNHFLE